MSYKINTLIASDKDVAQYEKRLSICLQPNGFSFSLTDLFDELLAIGEVQCELDAPMPQLLADIKGALSEAGIHTFGLKEAELVTISRQFVWVPQHLYDESKQRTYLDVLCKVTTGYGIFADHNETVKAYLVFSADNNAVSAFKIAVPGIKIRCQHSKLANDTAAEISDLKSLMLVNLRGKESDFAVFCNKKLQISNTYDCNNIDETVYFALSITKQLHLEDTRLTVAVCGDVDRDKYALFREYFPSMALYNGRLLTLTVPEMQHIHTYRHALILS